MIQRILNKIGELIDSKNKESEGRLLENLAEYLRDQDAKIERLEDRLDKHEEDINILKEKVGLHKVG